MDNNEVKTITELVLMLTSQDDDNFFNIAKHLTEMYSANDPNVVLEHLRHINNDARQVAINRIAILLGIFSSDIVNELRDLTINKLGGN